MIQTGKIHEFKECDTCAAKPGFPTLCRGCVNNRNAIQALIKMVGTELHCVFCEATTRFKEKGKAYCIDCYVKLRNSAHYHEIKDGEVQIEPKPLDKINLPYIPPNLYPPVPWKNPYYIGDDPFNQPRIIC